MSGTDASRIGASAAERHYWLTQGMARTTGVRLSDAVAAGRITRADLAQLVVRCSSCRFSDDCVRWMAEGRHQDQTPPAYCLNHEPLAALKHRG